MTLAVSAKGVSLSVEQTTGTYTKFYEVKSVPEVGASPDKIDATHLDSDMKEYIKDIPDFSSDLEFTMNAMPLSGDNSNLKLVQSLDEDETYNWKITYPSIGVQCVIPGQFSYRMGSGEVSAVQDLILTIIPSGKPVWSEAASTASVTYNTGE